MCPRLSPYILSGVLALAVGCGPMAHEDSWPRPRPLRAEMGAYRPPTGARDEGTRTPEFREPAGVVSLTDAAAAALRGSPTLAGFAWSVRMAEAEQLQAGLLPNPELEAEVEEFGGNGEAAGVDSAEVGVMLSVPIELGGKRRKRVALAAAERKLAGWDYETARLGVLTEVAGRFIDVLALQEKVALVSKDVALATRTQAAVAKRVEVGKSPLIEKTQAAVALALSDIALKRTRRELVVARGALAATWGSARPAFDRVSGTLARVRNLPPLDAIGPLLDQHPDLARWDQEIARGQAAVALARAGRMGDLTVGAGMKYLGESNDQALVVSVGIPLPLFDRNQGAISKARFALVKSRFDRAAAFVAARTALTEAYQALAGAREEVITLRDVVLPGATASFDAASALFDEGKGEYLDVLTAQQALMEARGQYIEALAAYHQGVARIEGLIAQRLKSITPAGPAAGPAENDKTEKKGSDR